MAVTLKIIQVNLNRPRLAQELLEQEIARENYNVAIVAEYYRAKTTWQRDEHGGAAIWVSRQVGVTAKGPCGKNYVSKIVNNTLVISCYLPPNETLPDFRNSVMEIAEQIQRHRITSLDTGVIRGIPK